MISCKMGTTIGKFLAMVQLEFHDLRNVSADMLMYIKEDLIIPHHYSFYDFIVTKARGKSGPLFNFDVHDDVRVLHDATKEKEDAHAGKVRSNCQFRRAAKGVPSRVTSQAGRSSRQTDFTNDDFVSCCDEGCGKAMV